MPPGFLIAIARWATVRHVSDKRRQNPEFEGSIGGGADGQQLFEVPH